MDLASLVRLDEEKRLELNFMQVLSFVDNTAGGLNELRLKVGTGSHARETQDKRIFVVRRGPRFFPQSCTQKSTRTARNDTGANF